jgi:hypothetical protein
MQAEYYSDKSIAIFGETKPWASDLRGLGGSFNKNLRGRPGWIFPRTKEAELMQFIANANAGMIQPTAPVTTQAQLVPFGATPMAMSPQAAMARLQIAQPAITQLQIGQPAPAPQPMITPFVPSPSPAPLPTIAPIITPAPVTPAPTAVLPPQPATVAYPNLFTAADGLTYQIIIYTVPLPTVGQRMTLTINVDPETVVEYTVRSIEKQTPPFDTITIGPVEGDAPEVSRAVLVNGVWKIEGMQIPHTLTFHS